MSEEPLTRPSPLEGRDEDELAPVHVPMLKIVEAGMVLWAVALVVTILVPALHEGARDWWPWACVSGIVLGGIGWLYVRRGRGNAADA